MMTDLTRDTSEAQLHAEAGSGSIPAAPRRSPQHGDHGCASETQTAAYASSVQESYTPYYEGSASHSMAALPTQAGANLSLTIRSGHS